MSSSLTISIVTPSFNQAAYIAEAIESVSAQSYAPLEHLVLDGASTDRTPSLLRELKQDGSHGALDWLSRGDKGQSDALNQGFARAKGDIIGWLNSDDRYIPGAFAAVAAAFEEHPEVDLFYGDYNIVDEAGGFLKLRREIEFSLFILRYHRVSYIATTATFFRRRIFDEGNFLDESLHYTMDFEFFVRLAQKGYCFRHLGAPLADFRMQPESKTCLHPREQLREHRRIILERTPLAHHIPSPVLRRLVSLPLRATASGMRYTQKLLHGYYFHQTQQPALESGSYAQKERS